MMVKLTKEEVEWAADKQYEGLPKEFTCIASRWDLLKAKLFGKRFDEPRITAYLYKGRFYITRLW